jgi:protein phosphatase 1L
MFSLTIFSCAHNKTKGQQKLHSTVSFLVCADWYIWLFQHAVAFVKDEDSPEAAARKLTEIAFRRGSTDNITCIVVEFCHDKMIDGSLPSTNQS